MNTRLTAVLVLVASASLLGACTDRATEQRLNQQDERINELERRIDELQKQVDAQHADPLAGALQSLSPLLGGALPPPIPTAALAADPRCTPDGSGFAITRADYDSLFDDVASVSSEVRIVPYFTGGKPQGFKVYSIRPQSVLASCGLRNGDVVATIDGMELSTPDKALDVYSKVHYDDHVDVGLIRQGSPLTLHVRVR